jgi:hypothetical protein
MQLPTNLTREQELYLMRLGVRFLLSNMEALQLGDGRADGYRASRYRASRAKRPRRVAHNKGKRWSATQRRKFLKTVRAKWKAKRAERAATEE